jgi:hypothetical protein
MDIRMGHSNPNGDRGKEDHISLDGINLYNREAVDSYIRKIEMMRDALWPVEKKKARPDD